jgi:hypothetical protein
MTVYPLRGQNTGAAAVVFPGGGHYVLAIDLKGTEVCDWLTTRGRLPAITSTPAKSECSASQPADI